MNLLANIFKLSDSMQQLILWAPTILFILIIVLWTIRGIMKGFRKSMINLITMILSIALCAVLFIFLIRNDGAIMHSLGKGLLGNVNNEIIDTIFRQNDNFLEGLKEVLLNYIADTNNGLANVAIEMYSQIEPLAIIILRLIAFALCIPCYFVFKFIFWIIYCIFFREGSYKARTLRNNKKYSKARLGGGVIGLVRGGIIGTLIVGFLGTIAYVGTAGRKPNESVSFKDETIGGIYDWNTCLRAFGDTGILKIFNQMSGDNAPFYLFFANAIAQAKYNENGDKVYLTDELSAITGIAQDLVDVLGIYAGENISTNGDANQQMEIISDLLESDVKLNYNGKELTFEEALIEVVERYKGTEYSKNFLKVSVGTVLNAMDEIAPNNVYAETLSTMFTDDGSGNYLSPYDLVTFDDCKTMLKGVIHSASEILDSVAYMNENKNNTLGITNRFLKVVSPIHDSILDLSIYTEFNEDSIVNGEEIVANKKIKLNNSISKGVDYYFTTTGKEVNEDGEEVIKYTNPYKDEDINWLDDFDDILYAVDNAVVVSTALETEMPLANNDMRLALTNIMQDDYVDATNVNTSYDNLVDKMANVKSVCILFESDFMYESYYDKFTTDLVNSLNKAEEKVDINIPRDIVWSDTMEGKVQKPGEFRVLFETLRELVKRGVLVDIDFNNVNIKALNKTFTILENDYDEDETVLEYMFNSKLMYYVTSLILSNMKNENLEVLVPTKDTYLNQGISLIKKEEVVNLISSFNPILEEMLNEGIEDFNQVSDDISKVLNIFSKEDIQDNILASDILTATTSSMIVSSTKKNEELNDVLVIPNHLTYVEDEETNQIIIEGWIGNDGEMAKLLHTLTLKNSDDSKVLDIDKLMDQDPYYIKNLTGIDRPNYDDLVASEVIHYSFTNVLTNMSTAEFTIVIPHDSYDSNITDDKVIEKDELYNTLQASNVIIYVDEKENKLDYDLDNVPKNKEIILKSDIFHATLISTIVDVTKDEEKGDLISLPKEYKELNYDSTSPDYVFNQTFITINWVENQEINYILESVEALELKLNDLVDGNVNQDELLDKVLLLNDDMPNIDVKKANVVCSSKVISLTMTNNLKNNEDIKEYINVPETAYDDINVDDKYIKESEWINMVDGLEYSFEVDGDSEKSVKEQLEDYNTLVSNVFKPSIIDDNEYNYESKKEILLTSYILEYSLVINIYDNLEEMTNSDDLTLIIPTYLNIDGKYSEWLSIRDNDDIKEYQELGNVLDVFDTTGLGKAYADPDFNDKAAEMVSVNELIINNNDYNEDVLIEENKNEKLAKQESINNSVVMKATTLNTILQTNAVNIPNIYNENNILGLTENMYDSINTPNAIKEKYQDLAIKEDVSNIFEGLNELKLNVSKEEPNKINIDSDTILLLNDNSEIKEENIVKAEIINKSKVLGLTLSNKAKEATNLDELPIKSYEEELGDKYITNTEWGNLVNAIEDDNNGLGIKEDVEATFANPQSVVKTLLGEKTDYPEDDDAYINKRNGVLNSYIFEEVIIKNIKESLETENDDNSVILPGDVSWYKDDETINRPKSEVKVLLNVFKILGLGDLAEDVDYANYISSNLLAGNIIVLASDDSSEEEHKKALQNEMLQSFILEATMINNVYNINSLSKPNALNELNNGDILVDTSWYKNNELENLFNVTKLLGLTSNEEDKSIINFNIDNILNNLVARDENKPINTLANSSIAYLTISNRVLETVLDEESSLDLYMPYNNKGTLRNYSDIAVIENELQNLINDINYLGIESITNKTTNIHVPSDDVLDNQELFNSSTMRLTISARIINETIKSSDNLYYIPNTSFQDEVTTTKVISNGYIESADSFNMFRSNDELKNFIRAVNAFNSDEFTFNIENLDDLKGIEPSILDSNIAYSIISKQLDKFSDVITNMGINKINKTVYDLGINSYQSLSRDVYQKEDIKTLMNNN